MPVHRRRVYFEQPASRPGQIEGWFSISICLAAAILLLSVVGCLPNLISTLSSLLPEQLSSRLGSFSGLEAVSGLTIPCEILMVLSAGYLFAALFITRSTRRGTQ